MGGMKIDPIEAPYHYFFVTVARARASWETSLAATVTHHARPNDTIINSKTGKPYDHQGDPHVALAALKCAHPDRWGQRKLEVVSKATVTHHANLSSLSEEELEALDRVHAKLTPDLYGEDEE